MDPDTRAQHNRDHLRYARDLTDAKWEVLAPLLPAPCRTGRRRTSMREIIAAIFYVLRAGCAWRLLPKSFSTLEDGLLLVCAATRRWRLGGDQPSSDDAGSRARRPRSQFQRCGAGANDDDIEIVVLSHADAPSTRKRQFTPSAPQFHLARLRPARRDGRSSDVSFYPSALLPLLRCCGVPFPALSNQPR